MERVARACGEMDNPRMDILPPSSAPPLMAATDVLLALALPLELLITCCARCPYIDRIIVRFTSTPFR